MSKTIVLDPGHGGIDPGAVNGTRKESNDALKLGQAVQKLLAAQGQAVIMTRTADTNTTLAQRTNQANAAKADLFVSLHRNSFTNSTANGVEIWVYTTAGAVEVGAATEVLERLVAVGVQSNRGVKKGNYHVCRETAMPAMLVELGFIKNAKDNELFDTKFDAYALAIAKGICAAVGEPYKEAGTAQPDILYRVQVGAFGVKANADAFLGTVRGMGLEAFLVSVDKATGTE